MMEVDNNFTEDQRSKEAEKQYLDFLDDQEDQSTYFDLVKNMIEEQKYRLIVNINDVRRKMPERANNLLENSFDEIIPFQRALKLIVQNIDTEYAKGNTEFFIGFEGSFGRKHTTPRTLTSKFLGNLVCVEGIVVRCSTVRPKIVRSVHYCSVTKSRMERNYTDLTSFDAFPSSLVYPTQDEDGNALETEYGLSTYKDHQLITIQEMPEKAPAGQLPRSVDIICNDDLVDICKPGDRVQIIGNYRCLPGKKGGYTSGAFRTVLLANNVTLLTKEASLVISHNDITKCKALSRSKKNIFELLSRSLAPSIHGHEYVKKAILCLLMGGTEKILSNGSRLRGDINVLMVGDPSVAKSQLLRYVLSIAPRAITTTGRGSSGVGLTAAVTSDPDTGERRLEAGAMVLADRGVICIDEFDKMSDIDRTAIHEVMEQGKVTIAKAGIHASLNARCSVLAAANPVYGRYDQYKSPMENIGLQDSLLSRFDLLFVMLDTVDPEVDHIISDHVVRMHRYRNPTEQDGEALPFNIGLDYLATKNPDQDDLEEQDTQVYETYNPLLHGKSRKKSDQIFTVNFMRKWIHIARCMKTKLTDGACKAIQEEYQSLRSEDKMNTDVQRTQPITARTLETLIRLSTAHAKTRLSKDVTVDDVQAAIELVRSAYFKDVKTREKKRRRRDSGVSVDDEEEVETNRRTSKRTKKNNPPPGEDGHDPYAYDEEEEEMVDESTAAHIDEAVHVAKTRGSKTLAQETAEIAASLPKPIDRARLDQFSSLLQKLFQEKRTEELSKTDISEYATTQTSSPFTEDEIISALSRMEEENSIMVSEGKVYRI